MARSDRTFTDEDIHRLYCNNLTPVEKVQAKLRIIFQACTGDNCPMLSTILNLLKPICLMADTGIMNLLGRVPYIGGFVKSIVEIACGLQPYLQLGFDMLCKDSQAQLDYSGTPLLEFINNNIIELQHIPAMIEQTNEEIEEDMIEYLANSTLQITMM